MEASALSTLVLYLITMLEFSATLTAEPVQHLFDNRLFSRHRPTFRTPFNRRTSQRVAQIGTDGQYERIHLAEVGGVEGVDAFGC